VELTSKANRNGGNNLEGDQSIDGFVTALGVTSDAMTARLFRGTVEETEFTWTLFASLASLSANRSYTVPDVSGSIPIVPSYSDLTAANAALAAGDFFWDTTLKKLRTATA
jgi:hypothetical protein